MEIPPQHGIRLMVRSWMVSWEQSTFPEWRSQSIFAFYSFNDMVAQGGGEKSAPALRRQKIHHIFDKNLTSGHKSL
jgi:hypothetical protein